MSNVIEMTHPLIQHKITRLRDKNTGTAEFSSLVEEIAMLMGYEALKDLPLEEIEIETPIETCKSPVIAGKKLAIVPILRAGLGMVSGVQALVPTAKIGHIGLYRDEVTHIPHEYYCKLPDPISERLIVVTDPMLATGGSAIAAVDFIKQHGGKKIKFMAIIKNSALFVILNFGRNLLNLVFMLLVLFLSTGFTVFCMAVFSFAIARFIEIFNALPAVNRYMLEPLKRKEAKAAAEPIFHDDVTAREEEK